MENKNGYFKPILSENKVFIKFFPPAEGGRKINIKDMIQYLSEQGYDAYDLKMLQVAINSNKEEVAYIGENNGLPFDERVTIHMSLDNMLVRCVFYAGGKDARKVSEQDIYNALRFHKVMCGIDEEMIKTVVNNHEYCTEYLIAKGTPPILGKDAKIEYFFSTSKSLKPKHNEDGSVNYHELNVISKVEKGQLLARLIPAVPGISGRDVLGGEIKAREVQKLHLSYSNNICLSEDETEIYSEVTGHVSLVQGKVFVSGVYEVPADVDNSIGNIDYPGNVLIKGNVKSGFMIKADGDIVVEGVVEGAQLYAGGQIVVKRGIHGMGKGLLSADGNIIIKFIESATVKSGGYVETESIIQSRVSAATEINVSGGKGMILGGMVRACNRISARTFGSEMGTSTLVEAGAEPEKLDHYTHLKQQAKQITKKIEVIRPILLNYTEKFKAGIQLPADKLAFMKQQILELQSLQKELTAINEEMNILKIEFVNAGRAKIEVQNVIYPGVVLTMSEISMTIKDERRFCFYVVENGEIKAQNL